MILWSFQLRHPLLTKREKLTTSHEKWSKRLIDLLTTLPVEGCQHKIKLERKRKPVQNLLNLPRKKSPAQLIKLGQFLKIFDKMIPNQSKTFESKRRENHDQSRRKSSKLVFSTQSFFKKTSLLLEITPQNQSQNPETAPKRKRNPISKSKTSSQVASSTKTKRNPSRSSLSRKSPKLSKGARRASQDRIPA